MANSVLAQLSYVWPILAASLVGVLGREFDKLIISVFFSTADFAVYSCGAVQIPLIGILTTSMAAAIMPNMVVAWEHGDREGALAVWKAAIRKVSLVMYPVFALCAVSAVNLMVLLFTKDYEAAAWPFFVYLLVLPTRVAVYGTVLRSAGQTRPIAVSSVVTLIVNISIGIALVYLGQQVFPETRLAFVGPAIGATTAEYAGIIYLLTRILRVSGQPLRRLMPWKDLAHVMGISLAAALPTLLIPLEALSVEARLAIRARGSSRCC